MGKIARRLVLTGHDAAGVSRMMSHTIVTGFEGPALPGSEVAQIWGSDTPLAYPDNGAPPDYAGFYAPLHGARVMEMYLPPNSSKYVAFTTDDPESGASALSAEKPGMHRTATTDIIIVMEGRVDCELDEETVHLNPGDVFIQNGTIHRWLNPHDEPARFLCAMVGASNSLCD